MPDESAEVQNDIYGINQFLDDFRQQDPSPEHSLKVDDYKTRHRVLSDQLAAHEISSEEYERLESDMYKKDDKGMILLDPNFLKQEILNQIGRLQNKASMFATYKGVPPEVIDQLLVDGTKILLEKYPAGKADLEEVVRTKSSEADEVEKNGTKVDSWVSLRPALDLFV